MSTLAAKIQKQMWHDLEQNVCHPLTASRSEPFKLASDIISRVAWLALITFSYMPLFLMMWPVEKAQEITFKAVQWIYEYFAPKITDDELQRQVDELAKLFFNSRRDSKHNCEIISCVYIQLKFGEITKRKAMLLKNEEVQPDFLCLIFQNIKHTFQSIQGARNSIFLKKPEIFVRAMRLSDQKDLDHELFADPPQKLSDGCTLPGEGALLQDISGSEQYFLNRFLEDAAAATGLSKSDIKKELKVDTLLPLFLKNFFKKPPPKNGAHGTIVS